MVKWAIKLSEFKIQFTTKIVIMGQALVDFIVDSVENGRAEIMEAPVTTRPKKHQHFGNFTQ